MLRSVLAAAGALCCAAAIAAPARADAPDLRAVVTVSRDARTLTSCPTTFTFLGKLYATNWAPTALRRVDYRFIRSDGGNEPTRSASFASANQEDVFIRDTWTISADGYDGWEAVEVLYPRHVVFEKVPFTLTCDGVKALKSSPKMMAPQAVKASPAP